MKRFFQRFLRTERFLNFLVKIKVVHLYKQEKSFDIRWASKVKKLREN